MKTQSLFLCLLFVTTVVNAQKLRGLDKSPMDMAYYPDNFAHDRKFAPKPEWNDRALVRVTYSRPSKKERVIFGQTLPYGKIWRTGANEATEVKFYAEANLQQNKIKAGVYSLYVIPNETQWTIILNSDLDQWGEYNYKKENDVLRFDVPVKPTTEVVENFTIQFKQAGNNVKEGIMTMAWDKAMVEITVTF
jgi:hypothetical protein